MLFVFMISLRKLWRIRIKNNSRFRHLSVSADNHQVQLGPRYNDFNDYYNQTCRGPREFACTIQFPISVIIRRSVVAYFFFRPVRLFVCFRSAVQGTTPSAFFVFLFLISEFQLIFVIVIFPATRNRTVFPRVKRPTVRPLDKVMCFCDRTDTTSF